MATELTPEEKIKCNEMFQAIAKEVCKSWNYWDNDDIHDLAESYWTKKWTVDQYNRMILLKTIVDNEATVKSLRKVNAELLGREVEARPICPHCKRKIGTFNGEMGSFPCNHCRPNAHRDSLI
jgi:hypothetical protein